MRSRPNPRSVIDSFGVEGAKATKRGQATNTWEVVKAERAQARQEQERVESEMEMSGQGWKLDQRLKDAL